MGRESRVIISGHQYRYEYDEDTQTTRYLGPVGDAPALREAEFITELELEEEFMMLLTRTRTGELTPESVSKTLKKHKLNPKIITLTFPTSKPRKRNLFIKTEYSEIANKDVVVVWFASPDADVQGSFKEYHESLKEEGYTVGGISHKPHKGLRKPHIYKFYVLEPAERS